MRLFIVACILLRIVKASSLLPEGQYVPIINRLLCWEWRTAATILPFWSECTSLACDRPAMPVRIPNNVPDEPREEVHHLYCFSSLFNHFLLLESCSLVSVKTKTSGLCVCAELISHRLGSCKDLSHSWWKVSDVAEDWSVPIASLSPLSSLFLCVLSDASDVWSLQWLAGPFQAWKW